MTGLLVRHGGQPWTPPATTSFDNEAQLKQLVKAAPGLLAEDTAVVDEFWVPGAGAVDLLGVGLDGSITLVECKLRKNPEIRREVVGQVLAYAGGLWRTPYDDFAVRYAARAGMPLLEHLRTVTGDAVQNEDGLRARLHAALQSGSFRLVIAVDSITEELKLVVEYLNGHTAAGVQALALEVEHVKDGDVEVLVPRLFGETSAGKGATPAATKLTEADIHAVIDALDGESRQALEHLLAHGRDHGHHAVPGTAGMSYWYEIDGAVCSTWAMYPSQTPKPVVTLSLGSVHQVSPERARRWLHALRRHPALSPFVEHVSEDAMNRWPSIPVPDTLSEPGVLSALLVTIDDALLSPST